MSRYWWVMVCQTMPHALYFSYSIDIWLHAVHYGMVMCSNFSLQQSQSSWHFQKIWKNTHSISKYWWVMVYQTMSHALYLCSSINVWVHAVPHGIIKSLNSCLANYRVVPGLPENVKTFEVCQWTCELWPTKVPSRCCVFACLTSFEHLPRSTSWCDEVGLNIKKMHLFI